MADINNIAKQFTDFYYSTFDSDRSSLGALYRPESMLTWEGTPIAGSNAIAEKLTSLPFSKVQHKVTTLDAQPSSPTVASLIVSVTGLLVVDDSTNPLQFSQIFQLIPDGSSYYVYNDIFRLNYG
ncbi:Nuclear transport factor 2 [Termitomyces sp. T159_Od127]|nr:Nuclear transport factor 2 [Termitomyces sp. T159_Od127]